MWNNKYTMKPENKVVVDSLFKNFVPPVQCDLKASKKAAKIKDEVMVPKYSGLLGGDVTAEQMYEAIKIKAKEEFDK